MGSGARKLRHPEPCEVCMVEVMVTERHRGAVLCDKCKCFDRDTHGQFDKRAQAAARRVKPEGMGIVSAERLIDEWGR